MAYVCRAVPCLKPFASIGTYFSHSLAHSSRIRCPNAGCFSRFTSQNALQVHLSRDHDTSTPNDSTESSHLVNFKCPVSTCQIFLKSRKQYLKHMPGHFRDGHCFTCGYPRCFYKSESINQFRVHVSREHPLPKPISEAPLRLGSSKSGESSCSSNILPPHLSAPRCPTPPLRTYEGSSNSPCADDPYSDQKIKDKFAKFYLKLESDYVLPTSTVQVIAEQIKETTELSHHCLKRKLRSELEGLDLEPDEINFMISKVFASDPIFNIHHRMKDIDQLSTDHFRQKYWKAHYPYVEPKEISLGVDAKGKKKCAHLFPLRESLTVLLRDPEVRAMVLKSFEIQPEDEETFTASKIFSDFTDGTAFADHMKQHPGQKCILLFMFQDGFDFGAFGPSQGVYKPIGFYYALGNIKSEYRTKLGCIQMLYLVLEKYFKSTLEEDLDQVDKIKKVLKPLLDELDDLKTNGIELDGEIIPVCLMFGLGDNAGQHFIGRFVQCFIATHCCRFCPVSLKDFKSNPTFVEPFRTPAQYDEAVQIAKEKFIKEKEKALLFAQRKREREMAEGNATSSKDKKLISKSAHKNLTGIHHLGVKYIPSALNSDSFHVSNFSLCVCIGHDLFEGILKSTIPAILKHLSEEKKWFDLEMLNDRIKKFTCEGNDKNDAPTPLKSFDSLGGNASENWTFLRVLPFMIEDFIKDQEDDMWCLFLQIKEIVEMVTAPKISLQQVLYLKVLIKEFLHDLAKHLPKCLVLKAHLLFHYPDLIIKWGPLIRLFTLRFESKHVFFKNVAKACKNYINITYTLARKYACKFALDHSDGLLPPDVLLYKPIKASNVEWSEEQKALIDLIPHLEQVKATDKMEVFGVLYTTGEVLQLGLQRICDLKVGVIEKILLDDSNNIAFLLDLKTATNSFNGYYQIERLSAKNYQIIMYDNLVDNYPLPIYTHGHYKCFVLKHSAPFVLE